LSADVVWNKHWIQDIGMLCGFVNKAVSGGTIQTGPDIKEGSSALSLTQYSATKKKTTFGSVSAG